METSRPVRGLIRQSEWLLRIASLLVPKTQRQGWYQKKHAEVWHWAHFLYESGRLNRATRLELAKHVCGALKDAVWLRFDRDRVVKLVNERPRTPQFCLLAIAAFFLIAVIGSGFAPTVRSALSSPPYKAPERLAHLSFNNNYVHYHLDSLFLAVSRWPAQSKTAEAVSAYSWEGATVAAARGPVDVISARVSPDFFDVLGVSASIGRLFHSGDEEQCVNCIVISNYLWQYGFHRDRSIVGKQIVFEGIPSTVVGVLPSRFWFISPEISLWTVRQSPANSFTTADRTGVLLRLHPGISISQAAGEFSKFVGSVSSIDLTSITDRVRQGTEIYLLFTMLAFFGSLALLAFRLVNSSGPKVHLRLRDNYRWWMFFAAKTVLLLATCFLVSLEGTRRAFLIFTGVVPPFAGPVCAWLFLVTTILALTWSLRDQRRRCPRCLKRLGHEIYVGVPAYSLLDFWGTELVCSQGHGILHVPEMRASWLEMEHWTPLDDSWKLLFESENAKVS